MNRGRNILKKAAAVAMSSSMILAGGSNVWAAGSYQETARASLQTLTESVAGAIDGYAQDVNRSLQGSKGTLTLKVEDTGKAIIGSMLGQEDLTWLQDLKMDMDISVKDGIEAIDSTILLNGEKICDLNIYQDMAEMTQYIQVPEISDAYIAVKTADEMNGESQEIMQTYMNVLSDLGSALPDAETTRTLLDRYGTLVIDSVEEGSTVEENVSVEGIGENCTVYEGKITGAAARTMLENILASAKDDAEIKGLFDRWTENGYSSEDQYTAYQSAVEKLLEDMKSAETDGSESTEDFSEKVWVNSENKIVGREIGIVDGADYEPIFTLKTPSQDGKTALLLEVGADDSHLTLTGSGASADGLLNGDYIFAVDGTETLDIKVENLELKPEKPGYYNGTFTVSFPESTSEDSGDAAVSNMLNGFSAVINMNSDASAETSTLDLSLVTSGVSLGTLSLTGGYGQGAEIPDLKSLGSVYTADDQEAMTEYLTNADWTVLTENLKKAGVPQELADGLLMTMESAVEDSAPDTTAEEPVA